MKTQRVSTNWTLFLKIIFPTIWLVFFGTFTLAIWFSGETNFGTLSVISLKTIAPAFFLLGFLLLYWAFMRLKRVEMDEHFVYVTNYFKTYRYPYHNIEKITEKDYSLFKTIHIHLKKSGNFGKKMTFVASRYRLQYFIDQYPNVVKDLLR